MTRHLTTTVDETRRFGGDLARRLLPSGVLLLSGDLGSGKTVLTQGLAEALGIDSREVQSPTFALIREHQGAAGRLIHADLYRLEPEQVPSLGLEELLVGEGIKVIEWAERLPFAVPGAVHLKLRRLSDCEREILEDSSDDEPRKEK